MSIAEAQDVCGPWSYNHSVGRHKIGNLELGCLDSADLFHFALELGGLGEAIGRDNEAGDVKIDKQIKRWSLGRL